MSRRYSRPGSPSRSKDVNPNNDSKYTKNRVAWLSLAQLEVVVMRYDDDIADEKSDVPGTPTINITFPNPGNRRLTKTVNLTSRTSEELAELKSLLEIAFALAEPIVAFRDKVAKHESERGDDSYTRLYRAVPEVFTRQGARPEDIEELRGRLEDATTALQDGRDWAGGFRAGGDGVAAGESSDSSPQDNPPEIDEP